jgi:integrase
LVSSLASLFEYLCDRNAVTHNPVKGVRRPKADTTEGKTPALSDHQARKLLSNPKETSLKGRRDQAILATLLYHALRREELCKLAVKDFDQERRGVAFLVISGVSCGGRRGHFGGPVRARPLIAAGGEWRGCRPEPWQRSEAVVMSFLRHGQIYQSDLLFI